MTAKEKANELIVKALVEFEKLTINEAKKIALIAVDEAIEQYKVLISLIEVTDKWDLLHHSIDSKYKYLIDVKQEIEKL